MLESYHDFLYRLYGQDNKNYNIRNITLQITDDCCCNCSYCYQINKHHNYMTNEIGKNIIDLLFKLNYNQDNSQTINCNTLGIILDFIGGEPLMNINTIDYICSYFLDTCISLNHIWTNKWKASMISNGKYYFSPSVQTFLNKFQNFLHFDITLDGPEHVHNMCRKYHNGLGNFNDAYAAFKDCQKRFHTNTTKVTISPENLLFLDDILNFFIEEHITNIYINPIYEHDWSYSEAKIYYQKLKKIADQLLDNNIDQKYFLSFFEENMLGRPLKETMLDPWCGGTGKMLAFDPMGNAFPCLRYMESSLGNSQKPLIIGNYKDGIYNTKETQDIYQQLINVNRKTQSTEKCFNCSIAAGCSYCAAWNYQLLGTVNSRCTYICNMHKARVLANVYYWNLYYKKYSINKKFKLFLSEQECLNIIDKKEYNLLYEMQE